MRFFSIPKKMSNKIPKHRVINTLQVFIVFALLMTVAGCRVLSDALDPDKNAPKRNLPEVKRNNPELSSERAEINVDPDSDDLTEETETRTDSVGNNSNTALTTNNNSSNENSNLTTEANAEQENTEANENYVVAFNSFGSVKTGMTVAQAAQVLGISLVRGKGYEDACYYVDSQSLQGVRFMITGGKIARIDISSSRYATDKGAKIGDTEDRIKSLYPGISIHPQKYDEKKHDMEIYSADEKYLIIFETDGSRVTGFRVGNAEEVGYVEGCS